VVRKDCPVRVNHCRWSLTPLTVRKKGNAHNGECEASREDTGLSWDAPSRDAARCLRMLVQANLASSRPPLSRSPNTHTVAATGSVERVCRSSGGGDPRAWRLCSGEKSWEGPTKLWPALVGLSRHMWRRRVERLADPHTGGIGRYRVAKAQTQPNYRYEPGQMTKDRGDGCWSTRPSTSMEKKLSRFRAKIVMHAEAKGAKAGKGAVNGQIRDLVASSLPMIKIKRRMLSEAQAEEKK